MSFFNDTVVIVTQQEKWQVHGSTNHSTYIILLELNKYILPSERLHSTKIE